MQIYLVDIFPSFVILLNKNLSFDSFAIDFIVDLDTRVVVFEENGGADGNSSVVELEVRVETLEGTAADHEIRLTNMEADVEGTSH